jgi:hypothetical protein
MTQGVCFKPCVVKEQGKGGAEARGGANDERNTCTQRIQEKPQLKRSGFGLLPRAIMSKCGQLRARQSMSRQAQAPAAATLAAVRKSRFQVGAQ